MAKISETAQPVVLFARMRPKKGSLHALKEGFLLLLFFAAGLVAEVLGTLGGFGSSVLFVPMASFFMDYQTVLGITAFFHIFSNVAKITLFRKFFNIRIILWFGVPGVLLVACGAWLSAVWGSSLLQFILGMFLCFFAVLFYLFPRIRVKDSKPNMLFFGGAAGFVAGLLGTGGAIRGVAMASLGLSKEVFVGTSAAIDMAVDTTRAVIYAEHGFLQMRDWKYMLILVVVAFLGSWLGKKWLQKISQQSFQKIVLLLVFLSGVSLIFKYLSQAV